MKFLPKLIQGTMIVGLASLIIIGSFIIFKQNDFLYPGQRHGTIEEERKRNTKPENIDETFIQTADKESIQLWHRKVSESNETLAIILTGNGDNVYGAGNYYQEWFASLNIPSLAFSYRGYGESSGTPSEAGLKKDIEAVHKYASQVLGAKKIIVFAVSIGTGPGTFIALNNQVHTMILVSPFESIKKVIAKKKVFRFFSPFLKTNFDSYKEFEKAQGKEGGSFPCSVLVHGGSDRLIPVEHSKNLHQIAKGHNNVKLKIYEDAGHNNIMSYAREFLEGEIISCLNNS